MVNQDKGQEMFDAQEPWIYRRHPMAHYYGDIVRQLLLFAAAVLLVGAPFYGSDLAAELPFDVIAALVLVCLAAFTSPTNRLILFADTVVAGVGMVIFEIWALSTYGDASIFVTFLRQGIALLFLFALYYGGKTLRGAAIAAQADEPPSESADGLVDMSEEFVAGDDPRALESEQDYEDTLVERGEDRDA